MVAKCIFVSQKEPVHIAVGSYFMLWRAACENNYTCFLVIILLYTLFFKMITVNPDYILCIKYDLFCREVVYSGADS